MTIELKSPKYYPECDTCEVIINLAQKITAQVEGKIKSSNGKLTGANVKINCESWRYTESKVLPMVQIEYHTSGVYRSQESQDVIVCPGLVATHS